MSHKVGLQSNWLHKITDITTIVVILIFALIFAAHHRFTEDNSLADIEGIAEDQDILEDTPPIVHQQHEVVKPAASNKIPVAIDDETEDIDEDQDFEIESTDIDFRAEAAPPVERPSEEETVVDFYAVQERPVMQGGDNGLNKYLEYPPTAKKAGINGKVTLRFVCSKQGIPVNIKVLYEKPTGLEFGAAAIKAMSKVRFTPGMQRDKPVAVSMTQNITFKIR